MAQDDPFEILGASPAAGPQTVRRAFRRRVLELHPDRNPGDPDAHRRLRRVLRAYEQVLHGTPMESTADRRAAPPPPPRARFECPRCDDTFPFPEDCPRCGVPLHDGRSGRAPESAAARDARVERWLARLERRAATVRRPSLGSAAHQLALAACGAAGFWGLAGFAGAIGMDRLALLMALYGTTVAGVAASAAIRWRGTRAFAVAT